MKKIFRCMAKQVNLFLCMSFLFLPFCFGANKDIFGDYKEKLIENKGFPLQTTNEIQKIIMASPYDSVYLYVSQDDFADLVNPEQRTKDKMIGVTGFLIPAGKKIAGSVFDALQQQFQVPKVTFFTGQTSLRGALSLHCGKPSFKIENEALDLNLKLKGFCGANYGVEEKLFRGVIDHMSSSLLHPYHVFFKKQEYKKVFINGKMYGLYLETPNFNKTYFTNNNIIDPSKKENCLIKMGRFVLPQKENPVPAVTSRLEVNKKELSDEEIEFVMETKYGDPKICMDKKRQILAVLAKKNPSREEISRLFHTESILLRGLMLWHTNNHVSLTHNYLFVEHQGKFAAGFRDVEDFQGCRKQEISGYGNKEEWKYNVLFGHVLAWYQKNNPKRLAYLEKLIDTHICGFDAYHYFKNTDLQYVLADRFLRNMGNITPIDNLDSDTFVKDFLQAYQQKMNFSEFFKKQYSLFDTYFGVKQPEQVVETERE